MIPASAAPGLWAYLAPVVLLVCSNLFMTIAWYGHLKFKAVPLLTLALPCRQTGSATRSIRRPS